MPRLDFIDISHWQNVKSFDAIKDAGVLGVIHKATEGTSYVDKTYAPRRPKILAAGLAICTYHFLKHGSISAQMAHYLNVVKPVEGERVVIDYEDTACNLGDLTQAVAYLQNHRPDLQITVYGAAMLREHVEAAGAPPPVLKDTSLWAARYSKNEPDIAESVWPHWTAWQFTDSGTVPGIDGAVDLNTFNGPRDACLAWFGPPGYFKPREPLPDLPQPEPEPKTATVHVNIQASPGVKVDVYVNGEPVK